MTLGFSEQPNKITPLPSIDLTIEPDPHGSGKSGPKMEKTKHKIHPHWKNTTIKLNCVKSKRVVPFNQPLPDSKSRISVVFIFEPPSP